MRKFTPDNPIIVYRLVFLSAIILYALSCAPGVLWQDGGMFQYRIWHNDIEGKLGLALSHPLYHIIGIGLKYIPLGEFAYRINLISSISGALTIANIFLLVRLWLGKNLPALLAAITLALSWTMWQFSSIAEVYTLYTALFSAEMIMLLQYIKTRRIGFLYLLGLLNGLAIANHMWAIIPLACYAVFFLFLLIQKQVKPKHILITAGLWILGATPYEYLIIKNIIQTGNIPATITSALFGIGFEQAVLNSSISSRIIKENLIFIAYNFATANILLFFAGLYAVRKTAWQSFKIIFLSLLLLFFVFAFRYTVPDRYAFFIPFYCLVPLLIAVGFDLVLKRWSRPVITWLVFILALMPIPVYIATPAILEKMEFRLPTKRTIPYRNDYTWFLQPWQTNYNGPERFATEALSMVEDNAIIYADGTTVYALLYEQQIKGNYKNVTVVTGHGSANNRDKYNENMIDELFAKRPIYAVSTVAGYCPKFLLDRYSFVKKGILYKAVEQKQSF